MRFFSKIVVICNICFIGAVICWYYYFKMKKEQSGFDGQVIPLSWLEHTIVVLGYGAIIVNALFLLICFIFGAFSVKLNVPKWIIIFNILIFFGQVYFFFFS